MAKTEDIEAKLAAYVDGELDPSDRAEIEKHLIANPQHRQLLEELMKQKDLVRALPRAAAPADFAEAFNSQLERAVLLGDVDGASTTTPMRIGYFSQLRAIAALLFLTVGLALLIYKLLPRANQSDSPLADLRLTQPEADSGATLSSGPATSNSIAMAVTADDNRALRDSQVAGATTQEAAAKSIADNAIVMDVAKDADGFRKEETLQKQSQADQNGQSLRDLLAERLRAANASMATASPAAPSEYVFRSNDLQAANREVTEYLTRNNINWEPQSVPSPEPLALAKGDQVDASRYRAQSVQVKQGLGQMPAQAGGGGGSGGGGRGGSPMNQSMNGAAGNGQLDAPAPPQRIVARQLRREQADRLRVGLDELQANSSIAVARRSFDATSNVMTPAAGGNGVLADAANSNAPYNVTSKGELPEFNSRAIADDGKAVDRLPTTNPAIAAAENVTKSKPAITPVLPSDVFALLDAKNYPLSLMVGSADFNSNSNVDAGIGGQGGFAAPNTGLPSGANAASDLVDVVILLESSSPATAPAQIDFNNSAIPMEAPTTAPAP